MKEKKKKTIRTLKHRVNTKVHIELMKMLKCWAKATKKLNENKENVPFELK